MISILTVNYRSSEDLEGLVESVHRHMPSAGQEVELVVTNNSADDQFRLPPTPGLRVAVLESPNLGFARGMNQAFRQSRGEFVMAANPDVRLTAGMLEGAVTYLEAHPEVGILLPRLRHPSGEVQRSVRRFYTWPTVFYARTPLRMLNYRPAFFRRYLCEDIDPEVPTSVDWGLGAAMFLRRADCGEEGIFDERFFMYFEDVDLCYRMWRRGRPVLYCPHLECLHAHRRFSRNPFSISGWRHLRSLVRFVAKYRGLPRRPQPHSAPQA